MKKLTKHGPALLQIRMKILLALSVGPCFQAFNWIRGVWIR
jgi:hypothetical protein